MSREDIAAAILVLMLAFVFTGKPSVWSLAHEWAIKTLAEHAK